MLEAYFTFAGRMRRFRLLIYSVALIVLFIVIGIVGSLLTDVARYPGAAMLALQGLLAVFWLCAWAAMGVKRLHDLNLRGWHLLWLVFAPQALILATSASDFQLKSGVINFSIDAGLLGLLGLIWLLLELLYLLLARGTDGPNRFGYPP